ncbi:MAG: hypothetical protein WCH43_16050, partial [Verrucomicrobiota bacterium]
VIGALQLPPSEGSGSGGKLPPLPEPSEGGSCKAPITSKPLVELIYPFTNHRVTLAVFPAVAPKMPAENQDWFGVNQLDSIAMTAPHRRAVGLLMGCD